MSLCLSTHPHKETFSPTKDAFKAPHEVVRVGQDKKEDTCLLPAFDECSPTSEDGDPGPDIFVFVLLFSPRVFRRRLLPVLVQYCDDDEADDDDDGDDASASKGAAAIPPAVYLGRAL